VWLKFVAVAMVLAVCAYSVFAHVIQQVSDVGPWLHRAQRHLAWAWLGCVALAVLFAFLPKSRKLLPVLLVILAVADARQTIRLARLTVSSDFHSRRNWNRINAAHDPSLVLTGRGLQRDLLPPAWIGGAKNNDNVPMKMATFYNYATMTNTFHMDFAKRPPLIDMVTSKDRIWFSASAVSGVPNDVLYAAFLKRTQALGAPVLVLHSPEQMMLLREHANSAPDDQRLAELVAQLPLAQHISFHLTRYTPNHLDLTVSAPADGWLIVTDRWCRGWRAQVNGAYSTIFGADFIFRAVKLRAGENQVKFEYRPAGWPLLLFLSWSTLACVAFLPKLQAAAWFKRRTGSGSGAPLGHEA
jgi:hypothetical protein